MPQVTINLWDGCKEIIEIVLQAVFEGANNSLNIKEFDSKTLKKISQLNFITA